MRCVRDASEMRQRYVRDASGGYRERCVGVEERGPRWVWGEKRVKHLHGLSEQSDFVDGLLGFFEGFGAFRGSRRRRRNSLVSPPLGSAQLGGVRRKILEDAAQENARGEKHESPRPQRETEKTRGRLLGTAHCCFRFSTTNRDGRRVEDADSKND